MQDVHGEIVAWSLGGDFTRDETTPGFVALVDDLGGVFLVLCFSFFCARNRVVGFSTEGLQALFRSGERCARQRERMRCIQTSLIFSMVDVELREV